MGHKKISVEKEFATEKEGKNRRIKKRVIPYLSGFSLSS